MGLVKLAKQTFSVSSLDTGPDREIKKSLSSSLSTVILILFNSNTFFQFPI